ncbi:MAG: hypothetical protein H6625_12250 [Bdellovibrionaceae bacterium]|nr:hypothetical protein [Pseudobdellovibrionaceae bacterium]
MKKKISKNSKISNRLLDAWHEQLKQLSRGHGVSKKDSDNYLIVKSIVKENFHALRDLWQAYNFRDQSSRQRNVSEAKFAVAYLLGFHLNNVQRNLQILNRVSQKFKKFPDEIKNKARILDLGCGSGAWSMTMIDFLQKQNAKNLEVEIIDRSRFLLQSAEVGLKSMDSNLSVKKLQSVLGDEKCLSVLDKVVKNSEEKGQALWVGLGYVWNELKAQPRSKKAIFLWLKKLSQSTAPVLLFVSDPGREREAKELQKLRENLVKAGYSMVYPCPKTHSCPMLKTNKDWCFSEVTNHQTNSWQPVSHALHLKRENLAVASYVFVNTQAKNKIDLEAPEWVAVGRPTTAYQEELLCCNGRSLKKIDSNFRFLRGETCSE